MIGYQCPICKSPLTLQTSGNYYACPNQHHFDLAKAGYLNLLPVQHKASLEPGDNKPMLQARRAFLEAGYFDNLVKTIARLIITHHHSLSVLKLLDLGCGEGYYSRNLATQISEVFPVRWHGIDIAKFAVAAAAKKQPEAYFAVASANRLPYIDQYLDGIVRVFAPSNATEINRVLKPTGFLIIVTPGPKHLWELKTLIYSEVREHPTETPLPKGFRIVAQERLEYSISPSAEHCLALLQMTPFAWKANEQTLAMLKSQPSHTIAVDFWVTLATKA